MVILFDAYMQHPELREVVKKDIELLSFFKDITRFVMERLDPLRKEIDLEEAEENSEEDKNKAIVIWILSEDINHITFNGYSQKLKDKMLSCFRKEDFDFFCNKQAEFIKIRNN